MGIFVEYSINNLTIKHEFIEKTLEAINKLHTKENLIKLAYGKRFPCPESINSDEEAKKYFWYSFVNNPEDPKGYQSIEEAIRNWAIIDIWNNTGKEDEDLIKNAFQFNQEGDFVINGDFDNKLAQQDILLKTIAPYCYDATISVKDEYGGNI
ncbi:hypothetical protein BJ944DRAFT_262809 [Cunninghamella echinulata]|nr:hypothetical protein BJ944DRAFT_262809 [Cunninghamella echinulata]